MNTPLDVLNEKLVFLRKEFTANQDKIDECETEIHECKLHQEEIKISIKNYELAMIRLKKE